MAWDAVGELSSLLERFRRPSVARNWELLNAVWTNFRRAEFSEGGLWMPSPSELETLIQGFVFLSDGTLGTSAFIKKRKACYSTATKVAAAEFRRLAQLGGDIITRIPQLETELRQFADGGGIGQEPDHERWWLAYLFREPASKLVSKDFGVEDERAYRESHRRGKHLPPPSKTRLVYECEVKGLYRASEAACERLIALLARQKVAKVKSNWQFVPFSDVDVKFGSKSPATKHAKGGEWWASSPPPALGEWHDTPLNGSKVILARCVGVALHGKKVDVKTLSTMHGKSVLIVRVNRVSWQAYFRTDKIFAKANAVCLTVLAELKEAKAESSNAEQIKPQKGIQKGAKRNKRDQTG